MRWASATGSLVSRMNATSLLMQKQNQLSFDPLSRWNMMSLREIDVAVAERIHSGGSLYQVDDNLLCELKPDLILTQNLCQVCATSGNDLASALKLLEPTPEILWMTPHSLEEIFENIRQLGQATDRSSAAETCIHERSERLKRSSRKPKIFPVVHASSAWNGPIRFIAQGIGWGKWLNSQAARMSWLAREPIPCVFPGQTSCNGRLKSSFFRLAVSILRGARTNSPPGVKTGLDRASRGSQPAGVCRGRKFLFRASRPACH